MKPFPHHNCTLDEADTIIFGAADESGSHAKRRGQRKGPKYARKIANRELKVSKTSFYSGQEGEITLNIHDAGNIKKRRIAEFTQRAAEHNQVPIMIGGDHSNTYVALKGLAQVHKNIAIIYFDTHPDFICSRNEEYFGSVLCDAKDLKNVKIKKSALIGLRAIEAEERETMNRSGIKQYTALDVYNTTPKKLVQELKKLTKGCKIYISIDLDALDPAFAPGVSTPWPGGLTTLDVIYIMRELADENLIGADIMEYCPRYDIQDQTGHVAVTLLTELLQKLSVS